VAEVAIHHYIHHKEMVNEMGVVMLSYTDRAYQVKQFLGLRNMKLSISIGTNKRLET